MYIKLLYIEIYCHQIRCVLTTISDSTTNYNVDDLYIDIELLMIHALTTLPSGIYNSTALRLS